MCSKNERELTLQEQQITVAYKVFATRVDIGDCTEKKGLFSVFTHIFKRKRTLDFYDYANQPRNADGYFETETAPVGAIEEGQYGFHVFLKFEDALSLLQQEVSFRGQYATFVIYKVAIKDPVAIGTYYGKDVIRCGQVMIISENLAEPSYNSPQ